MDPLTGFITIVGLITQYRSEVKGRTDSDNQEFKDWLNENRYTDLVDLLCRDSETLSAVENLIREDNDTFKKKLSAIETALLKFSSLVEDFDQIAYLLDSKAGLSDQAVSILSQMEAVEAEALLLVASLGERSLMIIRGPNSGEIQLEEPRYLDTDLEDLVSLGLLIQDYNSRGEPLYVITRQASRLVREIGSNS